MKHSDKQPLNAKKEETSKTSKTYENIANNLQQPYQQLTTTSPTTGVLTRKIITKNKTNIEIQCKNTRTNNL